MDGNILCEKARMIAGRMQVENFAVSSGWICSFRKHHGIVHKKVAGESTP
jgi:hypothetical protein